MQIYKSYLLTDNILTLYITFFYNMLLRIT